MRLKRIRRGAQRHVVQAPPCRQPSRRALRLNLNFMLCCSFKQIFVHWTVLQHERSLLNIFS